MSANHTSAAAYLKIWAVLAVIMLISVGIAELPISKMAIVMIVLGLSGVKATLVALYYMHLKMDRQLLRFIALFPLALVLLAIGVVFSSKLIHF